MEAYTGYIYAAMWLILAIYMFYLAFKHSKFLFVLSGFFLYSFVWQLTDKLIETNLFAPPYSFIYRGVAIVVLIVCIVAYSKARKARLNEENE